MVSRFRYKKVHIEITNVCNLKCHFCPTVARPGDFMTVETFARVLGEVKDLSEWICLHLMGEPTAHPHFAEIVELCRQANKKIYLVSNGLLLKKHRELWRGQGAFHQINLSLQSYWDNFPDKDIEPFLKGILDVADQLRQEEPSTYLNYRFWDGGQVSERSHQALQILLDHYRTPVRAEDLRQSPEFNQKKKRFVLGGRHLVHFDQRFVWPSLQNPNYGKSGFCQALRTHFGVLVDGTVVPCCLDSEGQLALGTLQAQPVQSALQGRRAQDLLKGFAQNQRVETFCQHCDFVNRFNREETTQLAPNSSSVQKQ